ncbi:MAG: GNAT family N-acetyltransferase [Promethearchaeota archaeon]
MTEEKKKENNIFPFIEGERIDLIAQSSKWVNLFCKWENDPRVRHLARHDMPTIPENIKNWFEPPSERGVREAIFFVIFHKEDKKPIGTIGFFWINWINRNAFISATIGEPEYWGKGLVGEAAKLLIKYGFTELNFHKICAGVYNPNKRSLRAAEKLGFKEEVVGREQLFVDGEYVDMHQFAIFKNEWMDKNNS